MVGILVSFWDGLFLGAMLVSGSVPYFTNKKQPNVGKYTLHGIPGWFPKSKPLVKNHLGAPNADDNTPGSEVR